MLHIGHALIAHKYVIGVDMTSPATTTKHCLDGIGAFLSQRHHILNDFVDFYERKQQDVESFDSFY